LLHDTSIELSAFFSSAASVRAGHTARAFASRLPQVLEARRWVTERTDAWPHQARGPAVDAGALRVLQRAKRIRVAGQHGAISALRGALDALAPGAAISWQSTAGIEGQGTEVLLCIEGPGWVDDLAEATVAAKGRVVMAGPGEHAAPPKGAWISDGAAGDGRFALFGPTFATLLAWAGGDAGAWAGGAEAGQGTSARPALFENPAWSLAAAVAMVPDAVLVFLATDPALEGLVRALGRGWAGMVRGVPVRGGQSGRVGLTVLDGVAGDAELFEALHGGPSDRLPVFVGPPNAESGHLQAWLAREGRPFLSVRATGRGAGPLGELVQVVTAAGVGLAALRFVDPLDDSAASAWSHVLALSADTEGVDEARPLA